MSDFKRIENFDTIILDKITEEQVAAKEEIPFNPPGLSEYIRDGARKNSAILRKMQGKATAPETAEAKPDSVQRIVSCPFCGNDWCSIRNAGNNGVLRQVYCRDVDCGARGPKRPSEDHAIAAWNNRAANDRGERPERIMPGAHEKGKI